MDIERLRQKCVDEYNEGYTFTQRKTIKMIDDQKYYQKLDDNEDRINTRTIYTIVNTSLASYVTDEAQATVIPLTKAGEREASKFGHLTTYLYDKM